MKKALIFGAIALLILAAGWLLFADTDARNEPVDPSQENSEVIGDQEEWITYQSDPLANAVSFTVRHPRELETPARRGNVVEFKYFGPNIQQNTEITDGFLLTVSTHNIASASTLTGFARAQRALVESSVAGTRFGGYDAIRYTTVSELDNSSIPHLAIHVNSTTVVDVSHIVAGDTDGRYGRTIQSMIDSLALSESTPDLAPERRGVSLAMLSDGGETPERGCDTVEMVTVTVPNTRTPLTSALQALFAIESETYEGYRNFIARTNDTLSFDRATVADGVAHIYLEGSLSGLAGVCDDPRAQIQIEETALQFETVDSVVLYLNGKETTLTPDTSGN